MCDGASERHGMTTYLIGVDGKKGGKAGHKCDRHGWKGMGHGVECM